MAGMVGVQRQGWVLLVSIRKQYLRLYYIN